MLLHLWLGPSLGLATPHPTLPPGVSGAKARLL